MFETHRNDHFVWSAQIAAPTMNANQNKRRMKRTRFVRMSPARLIKKCFRLSRLPLIERTKTVTRRFADRGRF